MHTRVWKHPACHPAVAQFGLFLKEDDRFPGEGHRIRTADHRSPTAGHRTHTAGLRGAKSDDQNAAAGQRISAESERGFLASLNFPGEDEQESAADQRRPRGTDPEPAEDVRGRVCRRSDVLSHWRNNATKRFQGRIPLVNTFGKASLHPVDGTPLWLFDDDRRGQEQ